MNPRPNSPFAYSRFNFSSRFLDKHKSIKNGTCLDIGCGAGEFINILESKSFSRIKSIDLLDEHVNAAKKVAKRAEVVKEDLFNVAEKFDVVIMLEVLEHIKNDGEVLSHIRENLMKEKGLFILSVPSYNTPFNTMHQTAFGHYRHYKKDELKDLLDKAGFKVLSFYSYGTKLINSMGMSFIEKMCKGKNGNVELKEEGGMKVFPSVWRRFLNPVLSNFYFFLYLIDCGLIKNTDKGIGYLVLCEK